MNSINDELFQRIWVWFLEKTIIDQTLCIFDQILDQHRPENISL